VHEGGGFLGLGVALSFRASLRQQSVADSLTAPGLVDELDEGVDEHGRDGRGLDPVVVALGVSAVVVAAAGVLQLFPAGDAVHDAAAAFGQVDDPRRERIAIRIIRLLAIPPPYLVDRRLLRLECPPPSRIEVSIAAAGRADAHVLRILEQLRLAIGPEVVLFEFSRPADAHAAVAALGSPAVLLDARDDGVRAEVAHRVRMPLAGHAVCGTMIAPNPAGVG